MGSLTSKPLEALSAEEIATSLVSYGTSYEKYQDVIRKSNISGAKLLQMTDEELDLVLDDCNVTARLHRRKLLAVLKKSQRGSIVGLASLGDDSSTGTISSQSLHSTSTTTTPIPAEPPQLAFESMSVAQSAEALKLLVNLENQKRVLRHDSSNKTKTPAGPPKDRACIVLTDIQHSTILWEKNSTSMRKALTVHDNLIRRLREQYEGYEIDTEGDAFFLAFRTASDGLQFATAMQAALREADWPKEILALPEACHDEEHNLRGLRVRMGIHMGPVTTRKNTVTGRTEYTGDTMEEARRVEGMAKGGQILTTKGTIQSCSDLSSFEVNPVSSDVVQVSAPTTTTKSTKLSKQAVVPHIKRHHLTTRPERTAY